MKICKREGTKDDWTLTNCKGRKKKIQFWKLSELLTYRQDAKSPLVLPTWPKIILSPVHTELVCDDIDFFFFFFFFRKYHLDANMVNKNVLAHSVFFANSGKWMMVEAGIDWKVPGICSRRKHISFAI